MDQTCNSPDMHADRGAPNPLSARPTPNRGGPKGMRCKPGGLLFIWREIFAISSPRLYYMKTSHDDIFRSHQVLTLIRNAIRVTLTDDKIVGVAYVFRSRIDDWPRLDLLRSASRSFVAFLKKRSKTSV